MSIGPQYSWVDRMTWQGAPCRTVRFCSQMDEMRHMWWQEEPHKVVPVDQSMYKTKGSSGWQVEVRSKNWIDWFKNDCWRRAHEIQTMECGWNWQTAPMVLTCMDALVNMWRQLPLNKPPLHLLYTQPGLAWRNHVESRSGDVLLRSMAPLATVRLSCQAQQLTSSIGM